MKNQSFHHRLGFALNGIRSAWCTEASFRFQSFAALVVILSLAILRAQPAWWGLLLLTTAAVLSTELLNTALEHLVDRLHPEIHPSIKLAKDCAAGAVLILSLASLGIFMAFLIETLST